MLMEAVLGTCVQAVGPAHLEHAAVVGPTCVDPAAQRGSIECCAPAIFEAFHDPAAPAILGRQGTGNVVARQEYHFEPAATSPAGLASDRGMFISRAIAHKYCPIDPVDCRARRCGLAMTGEKAAQGHNAGAKAARAHGDRPFVSARSDATRRSMKSECHACVRPRSHTSPGGSIRLSLSI